MTTNLRLLLDEAITDVLADVIRTSSSAINVEYVRELHIRGRSDEEVIQYAKSHRQIVVTTETGMDHRRFPVCTHSGILVLAGSRRHETAQGEAFRRFLLSGYRIKARDSITHITESEARIKSHAGDETIQI